ncbi:MAG: amino acid adenylation domain-containing protein [Verrucomicrobia bacterium]|nr:MAG: amino acid adenylation domain-containing protein [Verrucomicrobiota bacterium]
MFLDALPTTPNGKLDRNALPAPESDGGRPAGPMEAPRTPTEELLAGVWCGVLGTERVGIHDDFFESGGHSLLAMRLVSRIRQAFAVDLPVRAVFEAPTVAALAGRIEAARAIGRKASGQTTNPAARGGEPVLSFAQERLWFLDQLAGDSANYHIAQTLRVRGPLDAAVLERSLREIVRRHEALRTTCVARGGIARAVVLEPGGFRLETADLRSEAGEGLETEARRRAAEETDRPFDLSRDFMLRALLLRLGEEDHVLVVTLHHIASDGGSMGIFWRELAVLHAAFLRGEPSPLAEPAMGYPDHAAWQREWLGGAETARQMAYWKGALAGAPALLELPTDFPRPAVAGRRGGRVRVELDAGLAAALGALSRREGVTPFMTLLAAWQVLLARHGGQEDVAVGAPVAGRGLPEAEGTIGLFANTLVLRTDLSGNPTFRELLGRVRETTLGAYDHQDLPFEKLVEELRPERSLGHSPLFQVAFAFQNAPAEKPGLAGTTLEPWERAGTTAKFDLTLSLNAVDGRLEGALEYRADLFEEATIGRWAGHFRVLLEGILADAGRRIGELPLMDAAERRRVLEEWNRTEADFPRDECVQELFGSQVERTPGAVALEWGAERVSYRELDGLAEGLAAGLRASGVGPGTRVALHLERSVGFVAAVLGVLKAGGCYVPLPTEYPVARLHFMLADSGAGFVLGRGALPEGLRPEGCVGLDLDRMPGTAPAAVRTPGKARAGDAAYVMYTSGSSGEPKGVAVPHRAIARLVFGQRFAAFGPGLRTLLLAPPAFDASTLELWGPLLHGGTCVVHGERDVALERLEGVIREGRVNCLWLTAALFNQIVELRPSVLAGVAHVLTGGEALSVPHVEKARALLPGTRLTNGYGPTECTTFACTHEIGRGETFGRGMVPIGKPIANTVAYVLDPGGEPVPIGVPGELHVGGAGLALGYLGREGLTAERFVANRFRDDGEARLYRTGDRVRWRGDGNLEFLGRLDRQVKLRGFRIELGEIETVLARHEAVRQSVVLLREDRPGEARLVAYVVPIEDDAAPSADLLRRHLRASLPESMVPSAFVFLGALPLTENGKLDRRALPAPVVVQTVRAVETPLERVVAGVWKAVLRVQDVGVDDNFFELGGHSLLAMQLVARLREALGVELSVRGVFEAPTVAGLAERIERARESEPAAEAPAIARVPRDAAPCLSFAQERLWFLDRFEGDSSNYHVVEWLRLRGPLDAGALGRSLREIVRRHEALRTVCVSTDGMPRAALLDAAGFHPETDDLRGLGGGEREAEARRRAAAAAERPFDLARDFMLRARLLRLGDADHGLVVTMHHIASDGWSMGVFWRELAALYAAFSLGEASPLAEPAIGYLDHAAWQREWLQGAVLGRLAGYWKRQLAGAPALLALPTDFPRPAVAGQRGGRVRLAFDETLTAGVHALGHREGVTPFMALLAAWQVLLGRLGGQEDILVGAPIAARNRTELEGAIGFFANTLVLRSDLSGNPTVRELLQRVRETTLGAYAHQDLPFEKVVEALNPERSPGARAAFPGGVRIPEHASGPVGTARPLGRARGTRGSDGQVRPDPVAGGTRGPVGRLARIPCGPFRGVDHRPVDRVFRDFGGRVRRGIATSDRGPSADGGTRRDGAGKGPGGSRVAGRSHGARGSRRRRASGQSGGGRHRRPLGPIAGLGTGGPRRELLRSGRPFAAVVAVGGADRSCLWLAHHPPGTVRRSHRPRFGAAGMGRLGPARARRPPTAGRPVGRLADRG